VSKMQHLLSDKSVRAATVLGSWCSLAGAIPQDEVVASIRDKSKCSKGKEPAAASTSNIVMDSD
jgi:hypothetical protein